MGCGNILNMRLFVAVLPLLVASTTAWWIPQSDSCSGRCGDSPDGSFSCQCNTACLRYGDCCTDFSDLCSDYCYWRCGEDYYPDHNCHCNAECPNYGNCCPDYNGQCLGGPNPTNGPPTNAPPTNAPTVPAGNSCTSRCNDGYDPSQPCQCNTECVSYGNCCPDYSQLCGGGGGGVTPEELSALAQSLWDSDTSRAAPTDYTLNRQAKVSDGNTNDQSPDPLFTYVNEDIFSRPTFAAFIALMDNYNPSYGQDEVVTPEEEAEYQDFMDKIMATKVMTTTANFLISKGYFADVAGVRGKIDQAWFTLYDRSSPKDSSGFEHVFLGEYKSGSKVNGFHNWVQFYYLEKANEINYLGYVREDAAHDLLGANFVWNGYNKALGSFMYGASVEFELAMMTTCFTIFPGKVCSFDLNGSQLQVQTYTSFTNYVGSSYFIA